MTTAADLTKLISPGFTEDVLRDILRKKSGFANVIVRAINLGSFANKGDSYLSTLTRFTVEASGNNGFAENENFQVHVIVKNVPLQPARAKTFRSLDFFECEIAFYTKVWPTLDAFQRSKNVSEPFDSIPLCLATYSDGKSDFIALEDLSFDGYSAVSRGSGWDLEMTLFILRHFAHFHALSVAHRDQNPKEFEEMADSLKESYFDEKHRSWYESCLSKFFAVVKDAAQKELPALYLEKINEVSSQDVYGKVCKFLKERTTLCAVSHGDCWAPNFLLKGSGDDKKLALIDFQLMRCASLATDYLFILYTCVGTEVRQNHWDLLLKEYHRTFVDSLEKLGSKLDVTLDLLEEEVKKSGLFAFAMCNEALIMSLMEDDDVADLDGLAGDDGIPMHEVWKIEPIKSEEKRQRVASYLKHLIDNGFI